MAITAQPVVLHENQFAWSWSKVPQVSIRTFVYLKKQGCHWPMKFEHLLDKVNRGRLEQNSVGPTEKCERNRPLGGFIGFFKGVNDRFFTHTHAICIIWYSSSFQTTLPLEPLLSIKSFVKWFRKCKKNYYCKLVLGFSLNLEKKHYSTILWTV